MRKLTGSLLIMVSSIIFSVTIANAEICIGNRCTDASSVGPMSVRSSMTNLGSSWDCSGPGCSAFEQRQFRPLQLQKVSPITRLQLQGQSPKPGDVVRLKLTPGYKIIKDKYDN